MADATKYVASFVAHGLLLLTIDRRWVSFRPCLDSWNGKAALRAKLVIVIF